MKYLVETKGVEVSRIEVEADSVGEAIEKAILEVEVTGDAQTHLVKSYIEAEVIKD